MGRPEPVGQLEFRMKRQDRSFSGPPPAVSCGPDTPVTQIHGTVLKAHFNVIITKEINDEQYKYVRFQLKVT